MSIQELNSATTDLSGVNAENPWPGLLSFREEDQRWFQGRKEETTDIVRLVKQESLTVLFALSGIGKSSVLQAGVFPALRKDDILPVYIRLDYAAANLNLTAQVLETLAQSAAAAGVTIPKPRGGETLWEYFHNIEAEYYGQDDRRVLPLLVFDQFEEIFTLGRGTEQAPVASAFLEQLADLAEGTIPDVVARRWVTNPADKENYIEEGEYKVLISLREDFLPWLNDQKIRLSKVPQKQYRLHQMNGDGALLAVGQARELVEESVAVQIVRYVAGEKRLTPGRRGAALKDLEVEPALLSVVCRELNARRRQKNERKISADLLDGSQEDVLNDFYNRSFEGLPPVVGAFVEEQLITVSGARNSVPQDNALAAPGMTPAILEQLVERRLLRKEFRSNEVRLELTHDLLTGVARTSRDKRRDAEAKALQAKEREETAKKLRQSRRNTLGFGVLAAAALLAAVYAFGQTAIARTQTARANEQTAIAQEEKRKADEALKNEEIQRKVAIENGDKAVKQSVIAEQQTVIANTNAQTANLERTRASQEADKAVKSAEQARDEARKAVEANNRATVKTAEAETNLKQSELNLKAAEEAKRKTDEANAQIAKENAQNLANEAAGQIANNPQKALGLIARALRQDGTSRAARSLAFDQLLRGPWGGKAVVPGTAGADAFVHPSLKLSGTALFAVFSPNGQQVATVSSDKIVRIWDWRSGRTISEFPPQATVVLHVAFSPDGQRLVTSSNDGSARVWDVAQRSVVLTLKHDSVVRSAMYSSDGRRIVTASQDKTAQVWDAASGQKGTTLTHPGLVNYAEFSRDGQFIVTACADGNGRVWNSGGGEVFKMAHTKEVKFASFSRDGRRVVTASTDTTARIWDIATRGPVFEPMRHSGPVYFAAFSPDGLRISTGAADGQSRIWEASSGRPISAPLVPQKLVVAANFSPDSHRVVTASVDGTVAVWDVWYEFGGDVTDVVKLLEGISKYSAEDVELKPLAAGADRTLIQEVTNKANQQPATSFLRWFFSHRM